MTAGRNWLAAWGVISVTLILVRAVVGLGGFALEALTTPLSAGQVATLALWVGFSAYAEGYRGFQKGFCPRVISRSLRLGERRGLRWIVLAPFFCLSIIEAPRRERLRFWIMVSAISILVISVRTLAQPWRGIVDAGVIVGLLWGVVALWTQFVAQVRPDEHSEPEQIPLSAE